MKFYCILGISAVNALKSLKILLFTWQFFSCKSCCCCTISFVHVNVCCGQHVLHPSHSPSSWLCVQSIWFAGIRNIANMFDLFAHHVSRIDDHHELNKLDRILFRTLDMCYILRFNYRENIVELDKMGI